MEFKRRHFFLGRSTSGGRDKGFDVGRDLGRRKLIKPGLVAGSLQFSLLDGHIENKPAYAIQQGGYCAHQRLYNCPAKRTGGGFAQDGIVILEGAVGSFGCRSQAVQLAEALRSSGDFQKEARPLGNRNMGGKAELFRVMGTIPVQFKNGRIFGLHALLEAGKGNPLSRGIEWEGCSMKQLAIRCGRSHAGEGLHGRAFRSWDCNRSEEWRPACGQTRSYQARRIWRRANEF